LESQNEEPGAVKPGARPAASFFATVKAVAWSFLGIRRRRDHEADIESLNPVHLVIAGVGLAALFVITLISVVRVVVG
jgi:hypothetical protein